MFTSQVWLHLLTSKLQVGARRGGGPKRKPNRSALAVPPQCPRSAPQRPRSAATRAQNRHQTPQFAVSAVLPQCLPQCPPSAPVARAQLRSALAAPRALSIRRALARNLRATYV